MRPSRVLGYARVSSSEQAKGSSLGDQQAAIKAYAKGLGLEVARFYVEAESAIREKAEHRAQILALMKDVREGDLVVCDKLDRWSRDAEFSYSSVRQILAARASFYAVAESLDPSTTEGDTALSFRILFAREEHKRIKQRMVGTRRLLRDQGYYVEGLPPLGYRRAQPKGFKGAEKNILVQEPGEVAKVQRMFRMCIAGHSLTKIGKAIGVKRDQVASVLRSRVYLGEIEDTHGAWIRAKHDPIIDADTYTRARTALEARRLGGARPRDAVSETSSWILRDVATCAGCGGKMGAAYAGPHEARRYYYRCAKRCTSRFVPVRAIELATEPLIVERLVSVRDELAAPPKKPTRAAPVEDLKADRDRLQRKREKYQEAYADGMLTKDELGRHLGKLEGQLLKLVAREQAQDRPSPLADPAVRRSTLQIVEKIRKAWGKASPEIRRGIVAQLATSVRMAAGKGPLPVWRSPEELATPA